MGSTPQCSVLFDLHRHPNPGMDISIKVLAVLDTWNKAGNTTLIAFSPDIKPDPEPCP